MDRWMDGWIDGWLDGWIDEWIDGWMDGQMDGQIDRQIDRWMDRQIDYIGVPVLSNIDGEGPGDVGAELHADPHRHHLDRQVECREIQIDGQIDIDRWIYYIYICTQIDGQIYIYRQIDGFIIYIHIDKLIDIQIDR